MPRNINYTSTATPGDGETITSQSYRLLDYVSASEIRTGEPPWSNVQDAALIVEHTVVQSDTQQDVAEIPVAARVTNLTATMVSASRIDLAFSWPTAAPTVNIHRSTSPDFTPSAANRIALGHLLPTYEATGLSSSTPYYFQVVATNEYGATTGSNEATATTDAAAVAAPTITITTAVAPLTEGLTRQLAWDVTGNPTPTVSFASSNEAVATVHATSGLITAVADGSCTITATATNGTSPDGTDTYALIVQDAIGTDVYTTDFSEYTVDEQPADWSRPWVQNDLFVVRDQPGIGRALQVNGAASTLRTILVWDTVPTAVNAKAVMRVMITLSIGKDPRFAFNVRNAAGNETGYLAGKNTTGGTRVTRYVSGTPTSTDGAVHGMVLDTWFLMRGERAGNLVRVRIWEDGTPEPETWHVTLTDSSPLNTAGKFGLGRTSSTGKYYCNHYSIALNGAEPAMP
jgi:uncharacterized protein YjdB